MIVDRSAYTALLQLPNIGPSTAGDLRLLGIHTSQELVGRDPYAMYHELCAITGKRHDPCVIDVFLAITRFISGDPSTPWWKYTPERKATLAARGPSVFSGNARSAT